MSEPWRAELKAVFFQSPANEGTLVDDLAAVARHVLEDPERWRTLLSMDPPTVALSHSPEKLPYPVHVVGTFDGRYIDKVCLTHAEYERATGSVLDGGMHRHTRDTPVPYTVGEGEE